MRSISESDWRRFKELHRELLGRYCKQTLNLLIDAGQAPGEDFHGAYLEVREILLERHREMAELFDDFRRSTATIQLFLMRRRGLLADSDLVGFSEELCSRLCSLDDL